MPSASCILRVCRPAVPVSDLKFLREDMSHEGMSDDFRSETAGCVRGWMNYVKARVRT